MDQDFSLKWMIKHHIRNLFLIWHGNELDSDLKQFVIEGHEGKKSNNYHEMFDISLT